MMRPNLTGQENRLCYRLIEDVNSKVRYTSRVADANAARQEMQRAQSLVSTGGPLTTKSAAGQQATQNLQDAAAGVDYNAVQGGTRTGPSSADIMDQATIGAQGLRTNFNQTTGNIRSDNTRVNTGQIDEAARERLIAAGMTPEQAAAKIQENRTAVQGAFNQVGTNSGGIVDLSTLKPFTGEGRGGVAETPAEFEARKAAIAAQNTSLMEQEKLSKEGGQGTVPQTDIPGSTAAPTAEIPGTTTDGTTVPTPGAAGMAAAFANLPPEYAFLAPAFQQVQDSLAKSMAENEALTQSTLEGIDTTYGGIEKQLQEMRDGYRQSTEAVQQLLEDAKETNDEALAKQEKAERERLAWSELQQGRQIEKQKRQNHEAMVAQIALGGGFGQDASLRAVAEADAEFESRMDDLKINFSFARTDLAAKFSSLYAENNNNYVTKTTENVKELQSAMERIGMQGISNATARQQAEQSAMEGYVSRQSTLRTSLAQSNLDAAGQITTLINDKRERERVQEVSGWDQLKKAMDTYGANIPQAIVDSISKKLPGVDVASVVATPTLAQIKASRVGGGSGGGFSGYGSGNVFSTQFGNIPSFDEFIAQKEGEQNRSISAQGRGAFKAEYDAMVLQEKRFSVNEIEKLFADKIATNADLAKHSKESARKAVDAALARGDFQEARRLVEGTGKAPPQKQIESFDQAIIVRQGIAEIDALIDELGATGPVVGRFRTLNPYDSRIVRLNQLTTQVIPGLARGIYKEVGVLTDTDIATYRSTMANPNLTYDQAKTATKDTMRKIQLSLDTTMNSWDAAKLNTRDYRTMAETEPDVSAVVSSPTPPASQGGSVSDYVNSL
jgi:hypothetical protein